MRRLVRFGSGYEVPRAEIVLARDDSKTSRIKSSTGVKEIISGLEKKTQKGNYFANYHKIGAIMFKTRRDTAGIRRASHSGSWYSDDGEETNLESWFEYC